jgi:hypothetical protein
VSKILIVEDSPDNMTLFRTLLTLPRARGRGAERWRGMLETIGRDSRPWC